MRIFFAITLPTTVRIQLYQVAEEFRRHCSSGNWTHMDNFHLTLAFLGEMLQARVDAATTILHAQHFPATTLVCTQPGRFRKGTRDIWWVGLAPSPALSAMQQALSADLRAAGFHLDQRPFSPHLTLGRNVATPAGFAADKLAAGIEDIRISVKALSLMESTRLEGRLVYRELDRQSAMD